MRLEVINVAGRNHAQLRALRVHDLLAADVDFAALGMGSAESTLLGLRDIMFAAKAMEPPAAVELRVEEDCVRFVMVCTLKVASDEEPVQRGAKRSRDLPDGLCYVVLDDDKITRLLARKQIAKFGPHPSSIVLGGSRQEALSVPDRVRTLAREVGEGKRRRHPGPEPDLPGRRRIRDRPRGCVAGAGAARHPVSRTAVRRRRRRDARTMAPVAAPTSKPIVPPTPRPSLTAAPTILPAAVDQVGAARGSTVVRSRAGPADASTPATGAPVAFPEDLSGAHPLGGDGVGDRDPNDDPSAVTPRRARGVTVVAAPPWLCSRPRRRW